MSIRVLLSLVYSRLGRVGSRQTREAEQEVDGHENGSVLGSRTGSRRRMFVVVVVVLFAFVQLNQPTQFNSIQLEPVESNSISIPFQTQLNSGLRSLHNLSRLACANAAVSLNGHNNGQSVGATSACSASASSCPSSDNLRRQPQQQIHILHDLLSVRLVASMQRWASCNLKS